MGLCVAPNKENLLHSGYLLILAVCLHNWFGFLLGYIVGKYANMTFKQTKTLSIEVGLQNSGLAIGLSGQFGNPLCALPATIATRSEEHTSELQSRQYLVCRLLLEKKNK